MQNDWRPWFGAWTLAAVALASPLSAQKLLPGQSDPVPPTAPWTGPNLPRGTRAESVKLTSPAASPGDRFGEAVALLDGRLFVGAPGVDLAGQDAGAVYRFDRPGGAWTLAQVLLPSTAGPDQGFGASLSVRAGTLAVGAPRDGGGTPGGAVHCFVDGGVAGWTETALVTPSTPDPGAWFGAALELADPGGGRGRLIVGAPLDDTQGSLSGTAYLFEDDGAGSWNEVANLGASLGLGSGSLFGAGVALHGDLALVGAPYIGLSFIPGSAWTFTHAGDAWTPGQQLFGPLSFGRDRFGTSLVLDDVAAYVGAPRDSPPPFGLLSWFTRNRGMLLGVSSQIGPQPTLVDRLGTRLALDGERLLVTASNHGGRGAAYLYDLSDGEPHVETMLVASDGASQDQLGAACALEGPLIALGAPGRDESAQDDGAVYLFRAP